MSPWLEVADGVLQGRYEPYDVTVAVVRGTDGLLVIDTCGSRRQGEQLREDVRTLGRPVRCVLNTHGHFDHCFGNQCFSGDPIYGQRRMPAHLQRYGAPMLARSIAAGNDEFAGVVLTPPTDLVDDLDRIDLGDRVVDLWHLGRGHTDHDLLLHVDGTWIVGDLVEESGPPAYGDDSFPLDWPQTVAVLLDRLGAEDVVVPGHGAVVDRSFVVGQHRDLTAVEVLIVALHTAGVPVDQALAEGGAPWPFPPEGLADAVRRGYAQLG